jgi:hypothetical protein
MLLGDVAFVGAAPATSARTGVAAAASFCGSSGRRGSVRAACKSTREGRAGGGIGIAERDCGTKAKEKEENNGKSSALPRTRGLTTYNQIQEKERSHIKWNQCPIVRALARGQAPR